MQRNPHSPIADRRHHLAELNGGGRPSLAEHRRVAPPGTPGARLREPPAGLRGELDARLRADAELLHVVIALGVAHFVADLNEARVVGLREDPGHRHLFGAVRIVVVDLLAVGHRDRVRNGENALGRDFLLVDRAGERDELACRSGLDGRLHRPRPPIRGRRRTEARRIGGAGIHEGEDPSGSDLDDDGRAPLGVVGLDRIVDGLHELVLQVAVDRQLDGRTVLRGRLLALAVGQNRASPGDFDREGAVFSCERGLLRLLDSGLALDLAGLVLDLARVAEHVSGDRAVGVFAFHVLLGLDPRDAQRVDLAPKIRGNVLLDVCEGLLLLAAQKEAAQLGPVHLEQRRELFGRRRGAGSDEVAVLVVALVLGDGLLVDADVVPLDRRRQHRPLRIDDVSALGVQRVRPRSEARRGLREGGGSDALEVGEPNAQNQCAHNEGDGERVQASGRQRQRRVVLPQSTNVPRKGSAARTIRATPLRLIVGGRRRHLLPLRLRGLLDGPSREVQVEDARCWNQS